MVARRIVGFLLASVVGTALADQVGFFGFHADGARQRGALPADQRERLLRDAYACNREGLLPDEQRRCLTLEIAARQVISGRTVANHQSAEPQRQELRRLYEEHAYPRR